MLCVTASSVPSEQLFSSAGNLVSKKTSCLYPESVDHLFLCMKTLGIEFSLSNIVLFITCQKCGGQSSHHIAIKKYNIKNECVVSALSCNLAKNWFWHTHHLLSWTIWLVQQHTLYYLAPSFPSEHVQTLFLMSPQNAYLKFGLGTRLICSRRNHTNVTTTYNIMHQ